MPKLPPLADTRRQQLAVGIGELNRAAEALDRAAAAEHALAREADEAAQTNGLEGARAMDLLQQQAAVKEIAQNVAQAVAQTAPAAAQKLADASEPIDAATKALQSAAEFIRRRSRKPSGRASETRKRPQLRAAKRQRATPEAAEPAMPSRQGSKRGRRSRASDPGARQRPTPEKRRVMPERPAAKRGKTASDPAKTAVDAGKTASETAKAASDARQAASEAGKAAEHLADASRQLRAQMAAAAKPLEQESTAAQLAAIEPVREAVEQMATRPPELVGGPHGSTGEGPG